jgi:hypothetical protein
MSKKRIEIIGLAKVQKRYDSNFANESEAIEYAQELSNTIKESFVVTVLDSEGYVSSINYVNPNWDSRKLED